MIKQDRAGVGWVGQTLQGRNIRAKSWTIRHSQTCQIREERSPARGTTGADPQSGRNLGMSEEQKEASVAVAERSEELHHLDLCRWRLGL